LHPEANPKMASYNASAVKNYNATTSLMRFENKQVSYNEKKLQPTTTLAL
jgi:hypothetical protein